MNEWSRRRFLKTTAGGAALVTLPSFLASCTKPGEVESLVNGALPANPFLSWFGPAAVTCLERPFQDLAVPLLVVDKGDAETPATVAAAVECSDQRRQVNL